MGLSDGGQHTGQNLQPQVLLVPQAVGSALKNPDLVVEIVHESERRFVLRPAVGRDPFPMPFDHRRELLIGRQPLVLERVLPVVEEPPRPSFLPVVPQLFERFLEQIGRAQSFVGFQQPSEIGPATADEVLPARQQRVFLPFDEPPIRSRQSGVFAPTDQVEGFPKMPQDVELIVQDGRLRRMPAGQLGEGLPHIHDGQPDTSRGLGTELFIERVHAVLGPVLPPEPQRPMPDQIADDDPVDVPLAQRHFVDADNGRFPRRMPPQLSPHILHLEGFDRAPVEPQFLGHVLDGRAPAAAADVIGEALGIKRVVGQEGQLLLFHGTATPAVHPPNLQIQIDTGIAAGLVPNTSDLAVVPPDLDLATATASRFFSRRTRVITRAPGSPKMPLTVGLGRKPGNRYSSDSRRCRRFDRMEISYRFSCRSQERRNPYSMRSRSLFYPGFTHSLSRRA